MVRGMLAMVMMGRGVGGGGERRVVCPLMMTELPPRASVCPAIAAPLRGRVIGEPPIVMSGAGVAVA